MGIAVIGSANIDLSVAVSKMPEKGETVKCLRSLTSPGGKGANQAIAAARIGADVWFVAKIGNDVFGTMVLDSLKESGVHTDDVMVSNEYGTGKAFILVSDGDNRIVIEGGSNDQLTVVDVERISEKLLRASGVLLQNEIPMEAIRKATQLCKGKIPVFLNPAPAMAYPQKMLEGIDYFIPNESECEFYTGVRPFDQGSCEKAMTALREMGIRIPIITLGDKGVAYFDGHKCVMAKGFEIDAVDSTAAGDTFAGVFATMVSEGKGMAMAIDVAQAAAAITCTRYGAQNAIPYKDEVEKFLA